MASNGEEIIEVRMPKETAYRLAMEAHKEGVTFNDYIVRITLRRAKEIIDEAEKAMSQGRIQEQGSGEDSTE